ncbi:hypothetical protein KX928_15580 [Roseobacter sp. YSTF-M11]|uniref:Uncharacterized protein n=1 Tax=Roseobacter insulae TaxID=2859783 RepID=A0A9X1K404_9RHOB|nr:hypothetical protein [Roseobacter insulae]MBW4709212.1 hypothetical protein [Roseobacter insulae]
MNTQPAEEDVPDEKPEEFKPSFVWGRLDFFVKFVAFTFSTIAGTTAVMSFLNSQDAKLTDRSFDIVGLWEEPVTQRANAELRARVDVARDELGFAPADEQIGALIIARMISGEDPDLLAPFERVWYVLRRVSHCHESGQCDNEVLREFFCDYAQSFWSYFGKQITEVDQWDTGAFQAFLDGGAAQKQSCATE